MTATRLQHKDRRAGRVFVRKKTATRLQHRYRRVVCSSHILSPFIFFPFLKRDCALRHAHGCGVLPLIATWQCVFIRLAISLQYTARCNTLQHTATHYTGPRPKSPPAKVYVFDLSWTFTATHCKLRQYAKYWACDSITIGPYPWLAIASSKHVSILFVSLFLSICLAVFLSTSYNCVRDMCSHQG